MLQLRAQTADPAAWLGPRDPWRRYALAVLGVVLATLVRLPFEPILQHRAPYGLYFPVLAALAWFCGVGPTLLAAVLSFAASWYFFVEDLPGAGASSGVFLIASVALIALARSAAATQSRTDAALRAARRAQRVANAAAWDWDLATDALRSDELERVFGFGGSADSISRAALLSCVRDEDRERVSRALNPGLYLAAGPEPTFTLDFRIAHAQLGERWLSCVGEAEHDEGGHLVRLHGLLIDITERKQAEISRSRLAAIVESSEDAIIAKDLNGQIVSWNAAAQRMFGYSAEETVGRSVTMLIPHDRRSEEDLILARLRRGERVDHFETLRVGKDGRLLEVSLTISPIHDASGVIIGASKIARDVTERKRAERGLVEQREWFRVTLASIGDAVITADRDGSVTFLNPVAERLTGWTLADAIGQPLASVFQIVNERTREPVENPSAKVLRTGGIVGLANHTALIGRDGREHPIEDSAAPIIDDKGSVIGVVMVFHDVSERRLVENERRASEREREQLLESERAARSEAERANRLKDDFVATLSHELRTPLNAILGWTEIVKREPNDPQKLARGLAVIERNTRVQAQLISDLLDVSSIISGKLRLDRQLVRLSSVVSDAVDSVKAVADEKGVQIVCSADPELEPIAGDPSRLQQVVWNLLTNALKFTKAGGRVSVSIERALPFAKVSVSDTGVGIDPAFLPHVFSRFRQADASTTRRHGGLGLGLAIVKQLVEMHGGSVTAHSAGEGQGSTFVIQLPLDPEGKRLSALPTEAQTSDMSLNADVLEGLKLLVVEDDADARELVERVLSEAGCRVVAVASAQQAIDALDAERPDMLVSDIGLPDEDGYGLIQRVRSRARGEAMLPAIALTALARPEDRTRALRAGFQAHVAKPVDPAELIAIVASFAHMLSVGSREDP